jgi:hypothetical protein
MSSLAEGVQSSVRGYVVLWTFPCLVTVRGMTTVPQEPNCGSGIISLLAIF